MTNKVQHVKLSPLLQEVEKVSKIQIIPSLLEVICQVTGMGFAAVARVTADRWVACNVLDNLDFGLEPGGELEINTTFCQQVHKKHAPVIIDHVDQDTVYCNHPIPAMYGFQSYISMPIYRRDGSFFGTLCALDTKPTSIKEGPIVELLRLFAELIAFHIDALDQLNQTQRQLSEERNLANMREQLIAILGHDLKNPIISNVMSAQLLMKEPLSEKQQRLVQIMHTSSKRAKGLIDNMLDFGSHRLGNGLSLSRSLSNTLARSLFDIIAESMVVYPNAKIQADISLPTSVYCDESRVAQVFSNLLNNALAHGLPNTSIVVKACCDEQNFTLKVSNAVKKPLSEEECTQLFQAFAQGETDGKGLGLGLYISAEIARAHGGSLSAACQENEISLIFRMPVAEAL